MIWPFTQLAMETERIRAKNKERRGGKAQAVTIEQKVSAANRWREQYNPLRSLTLARAVSLMEAAQRGDFADLQWTYFFVEMTDATPFALVDRRTSALLELDWNIKIVSPESRIQGVKTQAAFDEKLAAEQAECLRAAYDRVDNLYAAIEHLAMASFRMYSHVQPHRDDNGDVVHLEPLDQWNWVRDGMYGAWKWNPSATMTSFGSVVGEPINEEDFLIRVVPRHIDRIALIKFIRKNLGEKDWAAFIEIYGIPGAFIIGPANVPPEKEQEYEDAATAAAEGGSGYLPNGSDVKFPDSTRGVNPFRDYIRYLDEQLVLAGTGGMLTMLTESGSGTLAGGAHSETFRAIARGEAQRISELFQEQFDKRLLQVKFPGRPILAYWELAANEKREPGAILDDAVKARNAGLQVDSDEISNKTGYKLTLMPPASPGTPAGPLLPANPGLAPVLNREATAKLPATENPVAGQLLAEARVQLAEAQQGALKALADPLLALYAKADAEDLDEEQFVAELKKFRDEELPAILKKMNADPETVKVFEEMMSAALANGVAQGAAQTTGGAA